MCSIETAISTLATGVSAFGSHIRPVQEAQRNTEFDYADNRRDLAAVHKQLSIERSQLRDESKRKRALRVGQIKDQYDEDRRKLADTLEKQRREARAALGDLRVRQARSGLRMGGSRLDTLYDTRRGLSREILDFENAQQRSAKLGRDHLLEAANHDLSASLRNANYRYARGLSDLDRQRRSLNAGYAHQIGVNKRRRRFGLLQGVTSFLSKL